MPVIRKSEWNKKVCDHTRDFHHEEAGGQAEHGQQPAFLSAEFSHFVLIPTAGTIAVVVVLVNVTIWTGAKV